MISKDLRDSFQNLNKAIFDTGFTVEEFASSFRIISGQLNPEVKIELMKCGRCGSTDLGRPINYFDDSQMYKCYRCGYTAALVKNEMPKM